MRSPNGHNGGGHNNHRRNNNGNRGPRQHGNGGGNMGGNRRPNPQNLRNQIFDSHGPNGERVRGNAFQVHEKYLSLAREAEERIDQENYYQHAEHYYRIVQAIQEMEAEQRARFTVVENADPFAGGADGYGEQPDLQPANGDAGEATADVQGQPRENRQDHRQRQPRHDMPPREQRQPRGPITQSDVMSEPLPTASHSEPMFSLADQPDAAEETAATETDGDDTPRGRGRGPRRTPVTA